MKPEAPGGKTFRVTANLNYYTIEKVVAMPGYHLLVAFRNGDPRVADIKAMRGGSPAFREVFDNFDTVGVHASFTSNGRLGTTQLRSKVKTCGQRVTLYRSIRE